MEFITIDVQGFESAMRGMRNPLKSYNKADSFWPLEEENFIIGPNDYKLAKNLWKGGTEHRKWMRQVIVWVEITAPRYWWSEFDTYKIGTSANSESTMHRLTKDGVKKEDLDFEWGLDGLADSTMEDLISSINILIDFYNECTPEKKKEIFPLIKGLLPESFMQKRTICLNYEVLATMYRQRKNHRLPQWSKVFTSWIKMLPYSEFITGEFND
jgi:hypothetical protein